MICIKCNKDKENTEFRYRHDRKKYYTICKSCVNLSQRIKRNGCEDVREYIERTKGNADETKVYSKKYGYAIKLVRNRKCDYKLCDCVIEGHQVRFKHYTNGIQDRVYCSNWCKETAEIDIKMGREDYKLNIELNEIH